MDIRAVIDNELIPRVEKPSRYLGCELNAVLNDPDEADLRIALAFPDLYDLGLSNLGILILYHILNAQPGVYAERVYAPWFDMEEEMRARKIPLFSLETRTPLAQFDAIGFTLQYELSYTNILNMLDLAGLPVLAAERDSRHPLILAGGPCAFNPEPLADFIDAFVIGDGEEVVLDLVRALRAARGLSREQQWKHLATIEGVYVPALYPTRQLPDGTVVPAEGAPPIPKRLVRDLGSAPFPTDYIVPYTEQVHDRVSLEVLRGCTQSCRFCQAGMIYRPVRERTIEQLAELTEETIRRTGYEEIALSSLSTCDYSRVRQLVERAVHTAGREGVAVSLPSLRLDSFSVDLAEMTQQVRKTGLTFAPEAATDRMRTVIDKFIPETELLETTREVFARGWDKLKLYFMIGLPTEWEEDVAAIAHLAQKVLRGGREVNRRARVNLGVSTFIPKPHTPFQWERQISIEETLEKQRLLKSLLKDGGLKFGRHDAEASYLEGIISRGDRRVGRILLEAHRLGCRFDSWTEHMDFSRWQEAFQRAGLDPDTYLRERDMAEPLPWEHIDCLVTKEYFIRERQRAHQLALGDGSTGGSALTRDCRYGRCNDCGVMDAEQPTCVSMLKISRVGAKAEKDWKPTLPLRRELPDPVCRLRFRFERSGRLRFLSHLETQNALARALRRAGVPVCYSQGFHPQSRLSLGDALPVGMETEGDYADVELFEPWTGEEFVQRMNPVLPAGLRVLGAISVDLAAPSLMSAIVGAVYRASLPRRCTSMKNRRRLQDAIGLLLSSRRVEVAREHKKGPRIVNIRPAIRDLRLDAGSDPLALLVVLEEADGVRARPREVISSLLPGEEAMGVVTRKLESFIGRGDHSSPVFAGSGIEKRRPAPEARLSVA